MLKPTLDVSTLLDVDAHSVVVTDNTDYAAIGITPADVKIAVEITTPVGLLYINPNYNTPVTSPDITSTSLSYTNTGLPLSGGKFIVGDYTVKLKWYSVDTEETFEYTYTQTINFEKPCVKFDPESDCFCAKLTSKDITDYSGSTQVDYEHKIYYPAATEEEPALTGLLEWTDDQLANGVYTMQVTTTRTWAYGDNFSVSQTLTGKSDYQVDCSGICDIRCGFNGLWNKYEEIKAKDKKSADILLAKINRATALWTLVSLNRKCGKVDTSNSYMAELKEILGDCGCDDCGSEEDIWVTGVCGSSGGPGTAFDYVFESCNNLINIDTDITGDTKTVTICLSQATLNTLVTNQFNTLATTIMATLNASWFEGLDTSALAGFPTGGTEEDKRQYILDSLATVLATPAPVAQPDYSVTAYNTTVDKLVTENDFFSSDVVVTITTAPSNGVATVRPDGKTIRFVPTTGYSGGDQVGYTITDGEGRTSSAIWYITVNPVAAIACSTVTPLYNLSLSATSTGYLQAVITNLSTYGSNVVTLEQYLVQVRDSSNVVLHSYTVTGSLVADPTVYTTPDLIAANWHNVRVLLTTTSDAATGGACGTETYETPTPFLITDIVTSWFEGTTVPSSFNFLVGDTEIEKKDKFMALVDTINTNLIAAESDIVDLQNDKADKNGYDAWITATLSASLTDGSFQVRKYHDGGVWVYFLGAYSADIPVGTVLIDGLPTGNTIIMVIPALICTDLSLTGARYQNIIFAGLTGQLKVDGYNQIEIAAGGSISFSFYYKT